MTLLVSTIFAALALAINPSIVGAGAAALMIILVWLGQRESQKINPYYLFLSTPVSLLLYSGSVSRIYLPPIGEGIQLLIIGAIFSYLAGLLFVKGGGRKSKANQSPSYSFYLILCLGLIPYFGGIATTGIPLLASDVNAARLAFFLPIIGQFTIFLPVTMLIAFKRQDRFLIVFSFTLNAVLSAIVVSRFSIAFSAIFFLYGYFRYNGRGLFGVRPVHLIVAAGLAIPILFEAVFAARESGSQAVYAWQREIEFGSAVLNNYADYTFLPYIYLTSPWSNFAYLFEVPVESSNGARSIYSIASFLQIEGFLNQEPRPVRNGSFNTHAFPSDFFLDFGVGGVILLSFFMGALVKWTYVVAQRSSDVLQEAIWVSFGLASFLLFFSNHFTNLSYPLISLALFEFYRRVRQFSRERRLDKSLKGAVKEQGRRLQ